MVFPECRLRVGQTIDQWYKEEKEQLTRSYHFSLAGLDSIREKMQAKCLHEWTRYEQLFYAVGETYPGMRCDKCGYERGLTDEERYPPQAQKISFFKGLFKGTT